MADQNPSIDALGEELEALVRELVACYERLREVADRRHASIRSADASAIGACVCEENELVQRVAELEQRRVDVVSRCAEALGSEEQGATRISWIAERLADPVRERVLELVERLRELIGAVSRQNKVSREAAEHLASHMRGLIARVAQHLNHAKTYGRLGSIDAGPRVVSGLDVTT